MSSVFPHKGTNTRRPLVTDKSGKWATKNGFALLSWNPISFFSHRLCQKLGFIQCT